MLIAARSIGLRAARILRPGVNGRVLAGFARACDLVTDAGEVIALVWGGIGNGPLNIVLAGEHASGLALPPGARFSVEGRILRISALAVHEYPHEAANHSLPPSRIGDPFADGPLRLPAIDLVTAMHWDPRPDWDALREHRPQIRAGVALVTTVLAEAGWTPARCGLPPALCERAARSDAEAIHALVGRGPGLTPAGDDWLAGWLLARRLAPDLTGLRNLSGLILSFATDRTTTLSRALLECAAAGEADESWHALLSALAVDPVADLPIYQSTSLPIYQSTQTVLSHGATSGAAMLLGFCAGVGQIGMDVSKPAIAV
jgi:hypothetical protein